DLVSTAAQLLRNVPIIGALAALTLHILCAGFLSAPVVTARTAQASRHFGENGLSARRRTFGAWVDGIESIKKAIPERGEYVLVEATPDGQHYFAIYELAPRRAWFLGSLSEARDRGRPASAPRMTVIVRGATE